MYIFEQVFIYLLAAVIAVPLAKRLGLGSLLGYLIAGIIIGPLIGLVTDDLEGVKHFAEFGVILMLFIIGLELKPSSLWQMKKQIIGLGGLQILLSAIILASIACAWGYQWNQALTIGLILSLSSTAIVLQVLQEKGWLKTKAGRSSLSVLLSQDIAIVPIFALLPLLATNDIIDIANDHNEIIDLPGGLQALSILGVILGIILIGRFLIRPVFRYIVQLGMLEIFTAFTLLLVVGIALLMNNLGLSPALGTFLAGVVLSDSEYRHEIESQIMPFKGMLMGLFFISIGVSINFMLLLDDISMILIWAFILVIVKFLVLALLARIFKLKGGDFWLFSLSLAQAGEFGFVLFAFADISDVIAVETAQIFVLVITISMILTPLLFILFERVIQPKLAKDMNLSPSDHSKESAVVAGIGRFGQVIVRLLNGNDYLTTAVDHNQALIEQFNQYGGKGFYGSALSLDLLEKAGIKQARLFVAAINNREVQVELVKLVKSHYPYKRVIARAIDRHHLYELEEAGADYIVRETFEAAIEAGFQSLLFLGEKRDQAKLRKGLFKAYDLRLIGELKLKWLERNKKRKYVDPQTSMINELEIILKKEARRKK
ncbi:monovalent cation:proton antiporter-2 (CPA2) family protein [Thiotrichales bacterium 19S9-12]|nr:monovalent cation:proton antiporter-2 (CPA2) family protein [Thiotrichales bacterium 19S9-11]MCF6811916.1 monovalent cation:proton antiporter-2 (CPA2) family protein [Thiotrichales bacterium 19S9-12]